MTFKCNYLVIYGVLYSFQKISHDRLTGSNGTSFFRFLVNILQGTVFIMCELKNFL